MVKQKAEKLVNGKWEPIEIDIKITKTNPAQNLNNLLEEMRKDARKQESAKHKKIKLE